MTKHIILGLGSHPDNSRDRTVIGGRDLLPANLFAVFIKHLVGHGPVSGAGLDILLFHTLFEGGVVDILGLSGLDALGLPGDHLDVVVISGWGAVKFPPSVFSPSCYAEIKI